LSNHISLELIDASGAVREAADDAGISRQDFFKKGALAGGGFLAGGVLFNGLISPAEAAISTRRKSKANDVKILNYALTLEYLEAAFYRAALGGSIITDARVRSFAQTTGAHETAHVRALRDVLGSAAVRSPSFDFSSALQNEKTFRDTAVALEDTGVSAYAGQGPNIAQKAVVQAALAIHSVEARHAAWIRFLNGGGEAGANRTALPAPAAFDPRRTETQVLRIVTATGFIES